MSGHDPTREPSGHRPVDVPEFLFDIDGAETPPAEPVPDETRPAPSRLASPRAIWIPAGARRPAVVATIAVTVVALVAGLFAWGINRPTDDRTARSSVGPTGSSPAGSGSVDPSGSAGPGGTATFEPIGGTPVPAVARLTASDATGAVVPPDATFRLDSLSDTPAADLAERLTVEPAVALAARTDGQSVVLTPQTNLTAGAVYRFSLHGPTGELLDSWAFQARQPLRIVGTLPEDSSADVPLDSGIEITFDQDGVTGADGHVSITPATPGRFEQHGRTLSFVPDRPLRPTTTYTVTVTSGIATNGTGEATAGDTRFRFETTVAANTPDRMTYEFPTEVVESRTTERAAIGLWVYRVDDAPLPASTTVEVHRLPSLSAAIDAFRSLRTRPDWTRWSTDGLVDVGGLQRVVSAELPLQSSGGTTWFQLPAALPAGWYVVQQTDGTKPIQTVLQVTDVAGYVAVSTTQTLVWANDFSNDAPLAGASVTSEGTRLGGTDTAGLAVGKTPASLLPTPGATCARPCDPVVVVHAADGREIFLPTAVGHDKLEFVGEGFSWSDADQQMWSLFHSDRTNYRSGDTVNLWGLARARDGGAVPKTITVRMRSSVDGSSDGPPVRALDWHPNAAGVASGSLSVAGLPDGSYAIAMEVDGRPIRTIGIAVGPIAKPAYRLDVTTGRRVYVAGDRVKVTVHAQFFEGTPVPGVPLRLDGFRSGSAMTDALGTAAWRTVATVNADEDPEGPSVTTIEAMPARAEEAEIAAGSREVAVFPSSRTIDAVPSISNGRVVATGSLHEVAVNRLESQMAAGRSIWELDPRGAAVRGATVRATFIELIPSRTQVGTEYDFIEKRVVPRYEDELIERPAGTVRVRTTTNGSWTASIPDSAGDHAYRIRVESSDPDGHVARVTVYASRTVANPFDSNPGPSLERTTPVANDRGEYGIGDRIDLTFADPIQGQSKLDGSRYLFFTAQRGIRSATVQTSPRFVTRFPTWGAPDLSIDGVRFTPHGYVGTLGYSAILRTSDRDLHVDLTTDRARYAPRQTVTVRVRTRSAGGGPVSATVILRAIDEKLFAIGAAGVDDPLAELYAGVGDGILDLYASHRDPQAMPEGGDTTGGGGDDRVDFRDSLLFTSITTGPDGRGSTSFRLSDDLTSWRVTGAAVTSRLQAGIGSVLVPVGLPFLVDASIAPVYLASDHPSIAVRTYGSALAAGAPVRIRVTSASLGFDSGSVSGRAFQTIDVPLSGLRDGRQTLTITATTGSGSSARSDRLTRTFEVVATRLTRQRTATVLLPAGGRFVGGDGITTVLIADASGGQYLPLLTDLVEGSGSARLDRTLAADIAARLLSDRFGTPTDTGTDEAFAIGRYSASDDGLALVPYGSSDLELSALVAIVAPERVGGRLGFYLRTIRAAEGETRERRIFALAGLAGLGEAVLPEVRASAADPDLTVREQLMLGLGAARLGDAATARAILDRLVAASGEGAGNVARLRVGTSAADITGGTALAADLAAAVGSPLAPRFWAYVEANPARDLVQDLPAIAFVDATLARLPVQAARFAWTVDGTRHVGEVEHGDAVRLDLTPKQLASLTIERIAGTVSVTTRWREAVVPSAFHADPDVTITRSIRPASPVKASDLVVVDLHVRFDPQASNACRQVTELLPSGLAPVGAVSRWIDPEDEGVVDNGLVLPFDQTASRVSFCVGPSPNRRTFTLRYVARVVTPGTYTWEPAIAQSGTDEGMANLTDRTSIRIR